MKISADGGTLYVNFNGHAGEGAAAARDEAERLRAVRVRGDSHPRDGALVGEAFMQGAVLKCSVGVVVVFSPKGWDSLARGNAPGCFQAEGLG